jgi:cytochrome c2
MNLREGGKVAAAILGSVALVAVCQWLPGKVFHVGYLAKPAYAVEGAAPETVDLASLRAHWPQALRTEPDRVRLLAYMRNPPKAIPASLTVGPAAAPAAPEPPLDLATRLARADVMRGERAARKCAACHSFEKGKPNGVGPNLWGVVGRQPGHAPGFSYSPAMEQKGGTWGLEQLDQFLTKPQAVVPGTRMTFVGLPNQQERADVIEYLRNESDAPVAKPPAPG